jgi:hypothetical protein
LVGPVLIALPYAASRALANRAQKWLTRRTFIGGSALTREQKEINEKQY